MKIKTVNTLGKFGCALALILAQTACMRDEPQAQPAPPPRPVAKPFVPLPPATPEATVKRLTNPPSEEVKPHRVEAETRFPESMASLAEDPLAKPAVAVNATQPPPAAEDKNAAAVAATATVSAKEVTVAPADIPVAGLTADGQSTELVMRDWTGIVLVPLEVSSSSAHTIQVLLEHMEAHPLKDGSVRVWLRVRNRLDKPIHTEVGCSFRTHERPNADAAVFYSLDLEPHGFRDVFFLSPKDRQNLNNYTVLVRSEDMLRQSTYKLR